MLEDLILRQLALEQARDADLDELASQRAAVISVREKAIVRDLHGDRAEALANAAGAEVAHDRTEDAVPIEPVVFVEPLVLGCDEGISHERRHRADRHVHPANILEMTDELVVSVVDVSALARVERANLGWRGTAVESARPQP